MSFGKPSWVAVHLLGPDLAVSARDVRSETVWYGTTAGPFGGIGGSAMSQFQMTLLVTDDHVFVFADETLWGWAPAVAANAIVDVWNDGERGNTTLLRGLLEPAGTCPVPVRVGP